MHPHAPSSSFWYSVCLTPTSCHFGLHNSPTSFFIVTLIFFPKFTLNIFHHLHTWAPTSLSLLTRSWATSLAAYVRYRFQHDTSLKCMQSHDQTDMLSYECACHSCAWVVFLRTAETAKMARVHRDNLHLKWLIYHSSRIHLQVWHLGSKDIWYSPANMIHWGLTPHKYVLMMVRVYRWMLGGGGVEKPGSNIN